jgi:hypothetical protein
MAKTDTAFAWPALPLASWQDTKDTLQLYMQIAGKLRLALSPPEPEFNNVTFYVTSRGVTTGPLPFGARTFQIDFDFIAHAVWISVSDGSRHVLQLTARPVAEFYADFMRALDELGITVKINPIPQELPDTTPFDLDTKHHSYDAEAVHRFWRVLTQVDALFKKHRAPFRGRHTPVQIFWGGLDLCYARYSGKPAAPPPSGPWIYRKSMDAQEIYCGFWPGDARYPNPAFASYVYPRPARIEQAQIRPKVAAWSAQLGEFLLPYDEVRVADSPSDTILEFLSSTYDVSATLAGWDRALLDE